MNEMRPPLVVFILLTVITGLLYPMMVTGVGHVAFRRQVNGSQIEVGGRVMGSSLLGQPFSGQKYFWSRPSATGPQPYNGAASSGSNQGPSNPVLESAVKDRIAALRSTDPGNPARVPVDLVTASGSGLDPHISAAAAEYQIARVARARRMPEEDVRKLVQQATVGRTFGILGEPRVNVLELNLSLDASPGT
ncbi:MAG: potassium-transporting ATPase subunit KdpC [Pseudomonadota bacterium]